MQPTSWASCPPSPKHAAPRRHPEENAAAQTQPNSTSADYLRSPGRRSRQVLQPHQRPSSAKPCTLPNTPTAKSPAPKPWHRLQSVLRSFLCESSVNSAPLRYPFPSALCPLRSPRHLCKCFFLAFSSPKLSTFNCRLSTSFSSHPINFSKYSFAPRTSSICFSPEIS